MAASVVHLDPLFDSPTAAGEVVDLCRRFGAYRRYTDRERIDIDLGRGLQQRHDSIGHFLRSGGSRGSSPGLHSQAQLAARTAYFREEYAYGSRERVHGALAILHHEGFIDAARIIHGRRLVEPAIVFANLMIPGQELAVHTDVPEFRGANRKVLPQWLLVAMHHSGLFERWRLPIATGIAWFRDASDGALLYWADGPGGPPTRHHVRANTAIVLDADSVFHGVDAVDPTVEPRLGAGGERVVAGSDGRWSLVAADGLVLDRYAIDEIRFSVSWKAYCFADVAERELWRQHRDQLDLDRIVDILVSDLVARGRTTPDVAVDRDLGLLIIDEYIRYPATSGGSRNTATGAVMSSTSLIRA